MAFGLLLAMWGASTAQAQEFNCIVRVNYSQLSGAKYTYLEELQRDIMGYLNNNTWTEDRFQEEERIECSMDVIIEEALTLTSFRARLVLTSRRPIYGTTQNSNIFQVNDEEWQFDYAQGSPLIFEVERFDPLASLIDFYAYIMLGYDYDSFSELGGTLHFQKARRILELAQAQGGIGWNPIGNDRSRSELITQLLDARLQSLRKAYFQYHFDGLDHFISDTQNARIAVLDVLTSLQNLYEEVSRQYVIDIFFSTKYQELSAVFEQSSLSSQAYALLTQVDPSHLTQYNSLIQ